MVHVAPAGPRRGARHRAPRGRLGPGRPAARPCSPGRPPASGSRRTSSVVTGPRATARWTARRAARRDPRRRPQRPARPASCTRCSPASAAARASTCAPCTARSAGTPTAGSTRARWARCSRRCWPRDQPDAADLAGASTLCGACMDACPVADPAAGPAAVAAAPPAGGRRGGAGGVAGVGGGVVDARRLPGHDRRATGAGWWRRWPGATGRPLVGRGADRAADRPSVASATAGGRACEPATPARSPPLTGPVASGAGPTAVGADRRRQRPRVLSATRSLPALRRRQGSGLGLRPSRGCLVTGAEHGDRDRLLAPARDLLSGRHPPPTRSTCRPRRRAQRPRARGPLPQPRRRRPRRELCGRRRPRRGRVPRGRGRRARRAPRPHRGRAGERDGTSVVVSAEPEARAVGERLAARGLAVARRRRPRPRRPALGVTVCRGGGRRHRLGRRWTAAGRVAGWRACFRRVHLCVVPVNRLVRDTPATCLRRLGSGADALPPSLVSSPGRAGPVTSSRSSRAASTVPPPVEVVL